MRPSPARHIPASSPHHPVWGPLNHVGPLGAPCSPPVPTHLSFTGIPSLPSSGKKPLQMPSALTWAGSEPGLSHRPFIMLNCGSVSLVCPHQVMSMSWAEWVFCLLSPVPLTQQVLRYSWETHGPTHASLEGWTWIRFDLCCSKGSLWFCLRKHF